MLAPYPELRLSSNTGQHWRQIVSARAGKMAGIEAVARDAVIAIGQIVAFGDDYNDVEMLRGCGRGVAVAGANPDARAAADEMCGDCDEDGVARWIKAYLAGHTCTPRRVLR